MMWQWQGLKVFAVNYARFLAFPLALVVGTIGYKLEQAYSNKSTPWKESVIERKQEKRGNGRPGVYYSNKHFRQISTTVREEMRQRERK